MKSTKISVVCLAMCLLSAGVASAQQQMQESKGADDQAEQSTPANSGKMSMDHGMLHQEQEHGSEHSMAMGGHGKCPMMHGGGMHGMEGMMERMIHIPTLPPGNEKLQLMMQAEILQKVGEVEAKYAAQIKDNTAP